MIKQKYKVAVQCLCFNHAPYVARTLDGLSLQETDFAYLAVIFDDASTDNTRSVINHYVAEHFDKDEDSPTEEKKDYIAYRYRHKTNLNFHLVLVYFKYNFYQIKKSKVPTIAEWTNQADYWAMCECDDYWIYERKLQEEVDFLEKNPEYGLVYTDYDIHYYDTGEYIHSAFKNGINPVIMSFEEHLLKAGYIAPMSWVCRIPFDILMSGYQGPDSIDMSFIAALEAFLRSKVYYMDKVTCVYGKHRGSATKQTSIAMQYIFSHGAYSTQKYYLEKYHLQEKYPNCLDYYINAYYCYIIAAKKEDDYADVRSFFKKKGRESIKYRLFGMMMKSKMTMPLLRAMCKYKIKNQM